MSNNQNKTWLPILLIAGALVAWGTILGVGAYLAPSGKLAGADYRKFLVLAATTTGFLLFWGLALAWRAAKLRRQRQQEANPDPLRGDRNPTS